MNYKLSLILILSLYCLISTPTVFADIRTIHSLCEISTDEFSTKTLVMFDLDDVLIYPQDALLQNWRSEWKPKETRPWTAEEDTIAWMNAKFQLMDPSGPSLINKLNENCIPTIGFTSFAMDEPGIVPSIPDWRSRHLQELGINFRMENEIVFPIQTGFIPPSFEKGILYCGDYYKKDKDNKGKILTLYLDWLGWIPDKVIFVDDEKRHIESVQREVERRGILFFGFLYIPKDLDPIDERVAELQYKTIIQKKQWLSDKEAKKLLSIDFSRYLRCVSSRK
jgi:hypothetical protein